MTESALLDRLRRRVQYHAEPTEAECEQEYDLAVRAGHRWAQSDDIFWPAAETCESLEAGFYKFDSRHHIGPCVRKTQISTDNLIRLPDSAMETVLQEFSEFWTLKPRFAERGLLHKRGILLWGGPGSGKTASLMLMAEDIIQKHNG